VSARNFVMTCAAIAMTTTGCFGQIGSNASSPDAGRSLDVRDEDAMCAINRNDEIRLRLATTCASCHGARASRPFFASLAAFEDLLVYNPTVVTPGSPDASPLIAILEGRGTGAYPQMPLSGAPYSTRASRGEASLSMAELREWIRTLPPRDSTRNGPDPAATSTRRLSADELLNAIAVALGQAPTSGVPPLLRVNGPQPLSPDSPMGVDYTDTGRRDAYLMLGGPNYLSLRRSEATFSPNSLLALAQVAQGACSLAVSENSPVLFRHVTLTDRLPGAAANVRRNLTYLYERFLQTSAPPEAIEALYTQVYVPAEATGTRVAWTQVCTALIRDPLFITF
jgi:hypothetical protein